MSPPKTGIPAVTRARSPVPSIGVIASEPGLRVRTEAGDVRDAADLGPGLGGWLHGEASS